MKRMTSAEIRSMFLRFFEGKGHKIEPSASLIPHDDDTLLWINAGVAPLKKYFDGRVKPEVPRICNSQKSIRTNDIENVGVTARHHTFFEMLGNFSIGDYFKDEVIPWAWELLTSPEWFGIDPEKLYVTIHPEDNDAFRLWHEECGLPENHIVRLEDNFWDIGEGPCGPNSEIFFDRGESYGNDQDDPELYPGGENERYLEIWNLVFSQYNHNPDGSYTPLPKKNIDTGMGLERMTSIFQDGRTNFDTDLFLPIIQATADVAGVPYGKNADHDVAFKVIADHIRMITFAIADGALPSNEGRGYVIRRLLRRAVRYGKVLGIDQPFLYRLPKVVAEIMGTFYEDVVTKQTFVEQVIQNEEERFHETLNDGMQILSNMVEQAKVEGRKQLSGVEAFKLYDTYGFPLDLTEDFVREQGLSVDQAGFEREMEAQRERARQARQEDSGMQVQGGILGDITDESRFVGYEQGEVTSKVLYLLQQGELRDSLKTGEEGDLILDMTPFYAESGGQVADHGWLRNEGVEAEVLSVKKAPRGQHLHHVRVLQGELTKGSSYNAQVDVKMRHDIVKNHTATHLLHRALKDILGEHVNQAGSLVSADRLRFDFSHFHAISDEELARIEAIVNEKIGEQLPVNIMQKGINEAKSMGAMALFGEKYGDIVRVVQVGEYSLELCGGCHVGNTTEIGLFKIISEAGIGAGTRRIEAVTGRAAFQYMNDKLATLGAAAQLLKAKSLDEVPQRIEALQSNLKQLENENESYKAKLSHMEAGNILDQVKSYEGINYLAAQVDGMDMEGLRKMVDDLKQKVESAIILLASVEEGKVNLVAGVTKDLLTRGIHAGQLIKEVATRCGGGGGGRPDMAQAGGKEPEKLSQALQFVEEYVKTKA